MIAGVSVNTSMDTHTRARTPSPSQGEIHFQRMSIDHIYKESIRYHQR